MKPFTDVNNNVLCIDDVILVRLPKADYIGKVDYVDKDFYIVCPIIQLKLSEYANKTELLAKDSKSTDKLYGIYAKDFTRLVKEESVLFTSDYRNFIMLFSQRFKNIRFKEKK